MSKPTKKRRKMGGGTALDWVALARPYDHHLSVQTPIWVGGACPELTPVEMHRHQGLEVGILLRGKIELRYGDYIIFPEPGDIWLSSMWEPHAWRVSQPHTIAPVMVFLPEAVDPIFKHDPSWLWMFAVAPEERPKIVDGKSRQLVLAIAGELYEEAQNQTQGWEAIVRSDLARLLITIWRGWKVDFDDKSVQANSSSSTALAQLMPAVELSQSNISDQLSPQAAAAACGLSLSRFRHAFRQTMGMGFGQFQLRCRLAAATDMLLASNTPIEAIAAQTGFSDGSHLHRAFRKQYGLTPAAFRERAEIIKRPRRGTDNNQ